MINNDLPRVLVLIFCAILQVVYCRDGFSCIGTCYSGRVAPESQDVFHGWHLKGYSFKNITTNNPIKCYSSCTQDCRCKACQMQDERCELLEEDKSSKSSDFVAASRYVYYDIKQTLYHGACHMLPPGKCHNGCCRSQPCMNGGTCTEHCQDPKNKFTCECPETFWGTVCNKLITSCIDVYRKANENEAIPVSGVYNIVSHITSSPTLPIYCHFNQSSKQAWTLIESFSFANREEFIKKRFHDNVASINVRSPPSWDRYRMSRDEIMYIRSKASLFSATCEYPGRLNSCFYSTDFLCGRLNNTDITASDTFGKCVRYEYINIRGRWCSSCDAATYYYSSHIHVDPSNWVHCFLRFSLVYNANYFGGYAANEIDRSFTCCKSDTSTTQWWLGEEL